MKSRCRLFSEAPFVDEDGAELGCGNSFTGLLDTLYPFLGISGDRDDFISEEVPVFDVEVDVKDHVF